MKLVSSAFANYEPISSRYTCDGENILLPLIWTEISHKTKSLVLICDDPDAPKGTWDYWIVFNLLPRIISSLAGINQFPLETELGKNCWDKESYSDPCLPDKKHRYFFKLSKGIIEEVELVGLYAWSWQSSK